MEYIKQSPDVCSLNDDQLNILDSVIEKFLLRIKSEAFLFETVHGHIVQFSFCDDCYAKGDKGKPGRFDHEVAAIFNNPAIRWVEFGADKIKVAV